MSIQIIDGFRLNVARPVDDRMVTSGTSSRNSIAYKYSGLRVFDIVQKTAFVWIDDSWKLESETSVTSSGFIPGLVGTKNKVVKFIATDKIGDSSIFDNGTFVGIGTSTPDSTYKLEVNGNLKATGFYGNGTYLTAINASAISAGTINIARLPNGGANQILASGTSNPTWIDMSSLIPGAIAVTNDTSSTSNHYINFTSVTSGSAVLKVSSTGLIFNPSKNQIQIGTVTTDPHKTPSYSFADNADTGMYRLPNEKGIGFSTNENTRMVIKSDGKIGIGTSAPKSSLHIVGSVDNTESTAVTAGQLFISDSDTADSGLILGYVYNPMQYEYARIQARGDSGGVRAIVLQGGGGNVRIGVYASSDLNSGDLLDVNGATRIRGILKVGNKTSTASGIEVGDSRTSNGDAFVDFIGTANTTDYDFRIIRESQGANAATRLIHKGAGNFEITADNAASIYFKTNNTERIRITDQGIRAQNGTAAAPSYYFEEETTTGIYRPGSNQIGFSISGAVAVQITSSQIIVNKTLNIPAGAGAGKVLTSNGSGDASWGTIPTPQSIPVGTILDWIANTAPLGYLLCDGSEVSRTTYANLFALLGTTFGTAASSANFKLPDLRGRVRIGRHASAYATIGHVGGAETVTLTQNEVPVRPHDHTATFTGTAHTHGQTNTHSFLSIDGSNYDIGNGNADVGGYSADSNPIQSTVATGTVTVANSTPTTTVQSHNNMQPYMILQPIIKF